MLRSSLNLVSIVHAVLFIVHKGNKSHGVGDKVARLRKLCSTRLLSGGVPWKQPSQKNLNGLVEPRSAGAQAVKPTL